MGNIVQGNFGKADAGLCSAPEPDREQPSPIVPGVAPISTEETKPAAYVKVRADIFHEMLDTIAFYASQHFDHGKRGNMLLNRMVMKEMK